MAEGLIILAQQGLVVQVAVVQGVIQLNVLLLLVLLTLAAVAVGLVKAEGRLVVQVVQVVRELLL